MYSEKERRVFKYFNGVEEVWADPLRVERELYAALGDPDACLDAANSDDARKRLPALGCLYENAREVFHMAPFDPKTGDGATEEDVDDALKALWKFLDAKKKNTADSLTGSPPTESSPPAP